MGQRPAIFAFVAIGILLTAASAGAISYWIGQGRISVNETITSGEIKLVQKHIDVKNMNNFDVIVTFNAVGEIENITDIGNSSIILVPEETYRKNITFVLSEDNYYMGTITSLFQNVSGLGPSVSGQTQVTVDVHVNESRNNTGAPSAPVLLSPANGTSYHNGSITLDWDDSTDPDGDDIIYYIYIDDDQNFTSPLVSDWTADSYRLLDGLTGAIIYYWKVAAYDGANTNESEAWEIIRENENPPTPNLTSPNSSSVLDELPTLAWDAVTDPDGDEVSYEVQVDSDSDFSSPEVENTITPTEYNLTGQDLGNGVYFWRVRASDGIAESNYSEEWNFTLDLPPYCGDGSCNGGESCSSCIDDCGACSTDSGPSGGGGPSPSPGGGGGTPDSGGDSDDEDETPPVQDDGKWELLTARAIIRPVVYHGNDTVLVRSVGVRNTKANPVDVEFNITDDLVGMVEMEAESIVLGPNETKYVNYTITLTEQGDYHGNINVRFTPGAEGGLGAVLASELYIYSTWGDEEPAGDGAPVTGLFTADAVLWIAPIIALVLIIGAVFIVQRRQGNVLL